MVKQENDDAAGIIDIHAHIIPGVDDGSRDMEETGLLLQKAYDQGIRKIIATPHYVNGHHCGNPDRIREGIAGVQEAAGRLAPDFCVYPGQEIMYFGGIAEALASGRVLTLAGTKYVLVEFPIDVPFRKVFQAVRDLVLARYYPVLAHIERYSCLRRRGYVEELIHAGAYMQMNYHSLEGMRHIADRTWCRRMVLEEKIHLLGTDMHRLDYRPPEIEGVVRWLERKAGRERFRQLTLENPLTLLSGELI